jgi:hypothetical protein
LQKSTQVFIKINVSLRKTQVESKEKTTECFLALLQKRGLGDAKAA